MTHSNLRGHKIVFSDGQWLYADTMTPTVSGNKDRPCGHCGRASTREGHDPCIASLPGVINACCGHGNVSQAYVQFSDMFCLQKEEATRVFEIHGRWIGKI